MIVLQDKYRVLTIGALNYGQSAKENFPKEVNFIFYSSQFFYYQIQQRITFDNCNQNKQNVWKKKIKTVLPKVVDFKLVPEMIYPGEAERKNVPGRAYMKAQK